MPVALASQFTVKVIGDIRDILADIETFLENSLKSKQITNII